MATWSKILLCKDSANHDARRLLNATSLCSQACNQRAGVKFLKHNVRDEFDDITDIARLYRIKHVPCFVFFSGGAMVRFLSFANEANQGSLLRFQFRLELLPKIKAGTSPFFAWQV